MVLQHQGSPPPTQHWLSAIIALVGFILLWWRGPGASRRTKDEVSKPAPPPDETSKEDEVSGNNPPQ